VPRAALLADELAKEAEFMSFGTNDLTQVRFAISIIKHMFSRASASRFVDSRAMIL
jgi:pyruvate,orthophosphate dikinase